MLFNRILLLLVPIFYISCSSNSQEKISDRNNLKESKKVKNDILNSRININTIFSDSIGWGYDIYIDSIIYIHQPHIPAVNGSRGFENRHDANIVAELVVQKIQNNQMPPSITIQELDSLGFLK